MNDYFRHMNKEYPSQKSQETISFSKLLQEVVYALAKTFEIRDPYTAGHQDRVAELSCAIAKKMNLPSHTIDGIRIAAILHDIGKISVPSEILSKPGILSNVEMEIMKQHPVVGYDILKNITFPWPIATIVRQHHEKMNGSGYPGHYDKSDIMIEARIITVADVVEAMSSHRPYRPSMGLERALDEIRLNRGVHYDQDVVDVCLELFLSEEFSFSE